MVGRRGGEPSCTCCRSMAHPIERYKMNWDEGPLSPMYNSLVHQSHSHPPTDLVGYHHWHLCLFTPTHTNDIISVISFLLYYCIYMYLNGCETFTHLFQTFPGVCVCIKSACQFCKHLFSLMKVLGWTEMSVNLFPVWRVWLPDQFSRV